MRVLLDTNILAELVKPAGNPAVDAAIEEIPAANVFLSVLTVGEIANGIVLMAPGRKKTYLVNWLAGVEELYGDRILPIDLEIARVWGESSARARKNGIVIPPTDGLIAATALRHGLAVMTRNERDFENCGVRVVNPWRSG